MRNTLFDWVFNYILLLIASIGFGYWQHSHGAGVFLFAAVLFYRSLYAR